MIDEIVGIIIWTDEIDKLVPFYQETLGLNVYSKHPDFVSFRLNNTKLGIGKHPQVIGTNKDPYRIMVNLGVDNIHTEYDSLIAKGVQFTRPPELEHWGGWVSTLSDPDGNTIQLMQLVK